MSITIRKIEYYLNYSDFMDKKILGIILVILAILVAGAYQFAYVPYQQEQNNLAYNAGLQNASAMQIELNKTMAELEKTDSSNFSAYPIPLQTNIIMKSYRESMMKLIN